MVAPATLTVPPLPVTAIASPAGEAPILLLMLTGTALLPDGVTETVATTPSEMVLEFNPHAMHVYEPTPTAQDTAIPAEDNAGPAATVKVPTLAGG